jgi:hypothetical protein
MTFHPALAARLVVAAALLGSTAAAPAAAAPAAAAQERVAATTATLMIPAGAVNAPQGAPQGPRFDAAAEATSFLPTPAPRGGLPAKTCRLPRLSPARDAQLLSRAGFRDIAYRGLKTHASRCSQFLYFSACRGATQYQVIVRYVKGRRSVVSLRSGGCRQGGRAA